MHGTGNDFVVLDGRTANQDWNTLATTLCNRHFGIGADGILVVSSSHRADFQMRMFNPDGSEAEMCGNGIRCFTKYVIDEGLSPVGADSLTIETLAGIHNVTIQAANGKVASVRVGMGRPRLRPEEIPISLPGDRVFNHPLLIDGHAIEITGVSMGNPHAVAFVSQPIEQWPLATVGPLVENHSLFPNRTNFEVVTVIDEEHLAARVWERGAGATLACGTGACAIAVAANLHGLTKDTVDIKLPGGHLQIEWDGSGEVWLEGPTELVFRGVW